MSEREAEDDDAVRQEGIDLGEIALLATGYTLDNWSLSLCV